MVSKSFRQDIILGPAVSCSRILLRTLLLLLESKIAVATARLLTADTIISTSVLPNRFYESTSQQPLQHGELPRIHLRYRTGQGKQCAQYPTSSRNSLITPLAGQLLILLQNRCLPAWRPLFAQTRQTILFSNHSPTKPLPKSRLRPEEQNERFSTTEPLRCILRGLLVRDVQIRRD